MLKNGFTDSNFNNIILIYNILTSQTSSRFEILDICNSSVWLYRYGCIEATIYCVNKNCQRLICHIRICHLDLETIWTESHQLCQRLPTEWKGLLFYSFANMAKQCKEQCIQMENVDWQGDIDQSLYCWPPLLFIILKSGSWPGWLLMDLVFHR